MSKQMTRDEWNHYCERVADGKYVQGRCDLEECVYQNAAKSHWLDCIDCKHWVEVEDDQSN